MATTTTLNKEEYHFFLFIQYRNFEHVFVLFSLFFPSSSLPIRLIINKTQINNTDISQQDFVVDRTYWLFIMHCHLFLLFISILLINIKNREGETETEKKIRKI
jgi:hypothetical protein